MPRVMQNRKSRLARPRPSHLSGASSVVGTGPVFGVTGLANAIWAAWIVSPREVCTPAAAAIVCLSWATVAAGIDLSTISATLSLLVAPGATSVLLTVLSTPQAVLLVVWL